MGILPLFGVIYHVMRLQKINAMSAAQYPHIPAEQFEHWKRLELKSIYLFLGTLAFLAVVLQGFRLFFPPEHSQTSGSSDTVIPLVMLFFGSVGVCFVLLIVSAVIGSAAARLRKSLNISVSVLGTKREQANDFPSYIPSSGIPYQKPAIHSNYSAARGPLIGKGVIACIVAAALGLPILAYCTRNYVASTKKSDLSHEASMINGDVDSPRRMNQIEKRVLALYYPWYQTPQISHKWAHQAGVDAAHKRIASHTRYPAQGPYDSHDPKVIDRHLKEAEQAGIDTLVCSWWGPKDATDSALRALLARAAGTKIKICVLWEQPSQPANRQTLEKEFGYLLTTFGRQPAYLQVHGKPVVFLFDRVCRSVPSYRWSTIQDDITQRFSPGALVIGDGAGTEKATLWDGQFTLGAASFLEGGQSADVCVCAQHSGYEAAIRTGKELQHISVVTVAPGYDDRKSSAASHLPARSVAARQDGKLYAALWQQAIADDPDWILVNSFNQWHAGTEIEPSAELGDTYLNLTRQYAAQFKNSKDAH